MADVETIPADVAWRLLGGEPTDAPDPEPLDAERAEGVIKDEE